MNQFFLDELVCIKMNITKKLKRPRAYCGNEINIIGDESALSAYLAAYNLSLYNETDRGYVNVITDGGMRNKALYDEIEAEFGFKNRLNFLEDYDSYLLKALDNEAEIAENPSLIKKYTDSTPSSLQ